MKEKTRTIQRKCLECGKNLEIVLNEDGTYEGGNYYGTSKKRIGEWTATRLEDDGDIRRCIPLYKWIYLKLRDFKRVLLREYEEEEVWFCDECDKWQW